MAETPKKKKKSTKAKSAVMLAFEAAKAGVKKAKEANKKTDNDATQSALKDARETLKTASAAAARERFLNVGGTRVMIVLDKMKNVARIANPKSYTFTAEDAKELTDAVNAGAKDIEAAFKRALETTSPTGEKKRAFQFSSAKTPG